MAHTKEDAQNFCSSMGKLAPVMGELLSLSTNAWVEYPDFCEGTEEVLDDDLVGSAYEGFDRTIPVQAFAMAQGLMPTWRVVYKALKKFI